MIYIFLFISCVIFIELFNWLKLAKDARKLLTHSQEAMSVIMSVDLQDDEKETYMRKSSIEILKNTILFSLKFLIICLSLYFAYWLIIFIFPEIKDPIHESIVSPVIIIGMTVAAISYAWTRNVLAR